MREIVGVSQFCGVTESDNALQVVEDGRKMPILVDG
jgi:hypothetical protein